MPLEDLIGKDSISQKEKYKAELTEDTESLKDYIHRECNEHYADCLGALSPQDIKYGIQSFRFDSLSRGEMKDHSARDLMAQLSCRILGQDIVIDSGIGAGSKKAIRAIQRLYNSKKLKNEHISVDGGAGPQFFAAVIEMIDHPDEYISSGSIQESNFQSQAYKKIESVPSKRQSEVVSSKIDREESFEEYNTPEEFRSTIKNHFQNIPKKRGKIVAPLLDLINKEPLNNMLTVNSLTKFLSLLYWENQTLKQKRDASYSTIGQVSKNAQKDGAKRIGIKYNGYATGLSSKAKIQNQLLCSYGYVLVCGGFDSNNFYKTVENYMLGPYRINKTYEDSLMYLPGQAKSVLENICNSLNISYNEDTVRNDIQGLIKNKKIPVDVVTESIGQYYTRDVA